MKRETAINAYNRAKEWSRRQRDRWRIEVLAKEFGGCGCRMHNHCVAQERGNNEGISAAEHLRKTKLAKRYSYETGRITQIENRLCDAFAKYF